MLIRRINVHQHQFSQVNLILDEMMENSILFVRCFMEPLKVRDQCLTWISVGFFFFFFTQSYLRRKVNCKATQGLQSHQRISAEQTTSELATELMKNLLSVVQQLAASVAAPLCSLLQPIICIYVNNVPKGNSLKWSEDIFFWSD